MLFVRYAITLPTDYDMTRIAQRVAAKADHWDRRAGLHLKAFCTAERGRGDAPHNVYAPFYVWADPAAFADFLTGPEYAGLSGSFGPVPVHTAAVLAADLGTGAPPAYALWESTTLIPSDDLGRVRDDELALHRSAMATGTVHTRVVALDAAAWTVNRLSLSVTPPPPSPIGARTTRQELRVLHLAQPSLSPSTA